MAVPGFYSTNRNRSYPFLAGSTENPVSGPVTLSNIPHETIVDCGIVAGLNSGFVAGVHKVELVAIRRIPGTLFFDFTSDAPGLYGSVLTFMSETESDEYVSILSNAGSDTGVSLSDTVCEEEDWWGYLVIGRLPSLLAVIADGETLSGALTVEPSKVTTLADSYVASVNVANDERTRVASPDTCDEMSWPFVLEDIYINKLCLAGDVQFKGGYNCSVRQDTQSNTLFFAAEVGAGEGRPCGDIPLIPEEIPPPGSRLLSGGPTCNEVVRSINGLGGRVFTVTAGLGVEVIPVPGSNKLIVDLNFTGLATCSTAISQVSEL